MSGDSDYVELVRHLKSEGVRVEIAAVKENSAKILLDEADHFHAITKGDWFEYNRPRFNNYNKQNTNQNNNNQNTEHNSQIQDIQAPKPYSPPLAKGFDSIEDIKKKLEEKQGEDRQASLEETVSEPEKKTKRATKKTAKKKTVKKK